MQNIINITILCILLFLSVAVLVLRVVRVTNRPIWDDGFTYIRTARQIAESRAWPDTLDFYCVSNRQGDRFTLPPLLMFLLVPFHKMDYKHFSNIPYLLDILIALSIFFFSQILLSTTVWQAAAGSFVYLLSPIIAFTQTKLTPRQLGSLFLLLFASFFSLYHQRGDTYFLILCIFCVCLLLLSQRMATQVLFIGAPFTGAFLYIITPKLGLYFFICILAGILLAFILTGGRYGIVIHDHFLRILQHARYGDQSTFRKKFGNPIQVVKANPWVIYLAFLVMIHGFSVTHITVPVGYLVTAMLLSILWVFGNSVNHVYFTSPFAALLLCQYLLKDYFETFFMLAIALCCFYMIYREYTAISKQHINEQWLECFDSIRKKNLNGYILVLPSIACPPLVYYTDLRLISAGHGSQAMEFNRIFLRENCSDPEFVRKFANEAGVSYILLHKERMQWTEIISQKNEFPTLFENELLRLLVVVH